MFKDPVLSIMLHAPLLFFYCLCLHGSEASIVFRGFAFLAASIQLRGKKLSSRSSGLFKLAVLKYVLECCPINKVHE